MPPILYFIVDSKLHSVQPIALHTYFGNIDSTEYEIQNWNDGDTWRVQKNCYSIFDSEKVIVNTLQMNYGWKRYDLIARLILGIDFKECSKGITYNSLPDMASWPYERTYIEYPVLKTILSDKKVISEIKRMKELTTK